jgi:proline dehydrogenase
MTTSNGAIQFVMRRAGSVYMGGPAIEDVRSICQRLQREGIASTVGYWNRRLDSPRIILESYLRALEFIRELQCDCYLSIKAPAFGFDAGLLEQILCQAKLTNTAVHFDSMAPDTVDRTFALIDEARRLYPNIGCTLPARWRRSLRDVDRVVNLGLRVRVVKGQWAGLRGDERDPRQGFREVIDHLVAKRARSVAIATHNPAAADYTLTQLKMAGLSCELELLHGLPERRMMEIARKHAAAIRVYIPYGDPALPYRLTEVGRDPRILFWFTRDLLRATLHKRSL